MATYTIHLKDGSTRSIEADYFRSMNGGLVFVRGDEDEFERIKCEYDLVTWPSTETGKRLRLPKLISQG